MHDFSDALNHLGNKQFHKRIRDEIIMIPIPKLRIQKKCPVGMKQRDFNDWVIEEQRHILEWAIERVRIRRFKFRLKFVTNYFYSL